MAVITKYIVVRDGVELDQVFADKKEAEAYDKMLDAAQSLAALIRENDPKIGIDDNLIDEISIYLAKNALTVTKILRSVKTIKSASKTPNQPKPVEGSFAEEKSKGRDQKPKAKSKAN